MSLTAAATQTTRCGSGGRLGLSGTPSYGGGHGAAPADPARWHCEWCDAPWPCDSARMRQYGSDRVGLSMYMGGRLSLAAGELPTAPPGELFDRFVHWTR